MKKIKSLISCLLLFSMLASMFVAANAAESSTKSGERTGITIDNVKTDGVTHPEGYYWSGKQLEEFPVTYEAWIYIPYEFYNEEGNVILGNIPHSYAVSTNYWFSFEIKWKGEPKLMFGDGDTVVEVVLWESSRIPADRWTHLAIVHDINNSSVKCYVNGQFTQTKKFGVADFKPDEKILDNPIALAGDGFSANQRAFAGSIGDVAVYSDMRTTTEIVNDYRKGPDVNDENLMLYYKLSEDKNGKDIEDLSGNGYDMKYYSMFITEDEMEDIRDKDDKEYAYSIAFLPDIQFITDRYPNKLAPIFDYVINNKDKKNIKYMVGLGDLTDRNTSQEWSRVKEQFDRLNGVLPYSLVRGNHDGANFLDTLFGKTTSEYYKHVAANGGFYKESSVTNTYLLFEENNTKYMILNLDFGIGENVLNWADNVISEHPEHRVMIVTHAYLNSNGAHLTKGDWATPSGSNASYADPDQMWEKHFKKHANIDMIVCGHMPSDQIIVTPAVGDNGNTVYQILIDGQAADTTDFAGLGLVGLMYVTEDGRFAKIEYYSTAYEKYYYGGHTDISLDFDAVASCNVNISGKATLSGRDITSEEFAFLLCAANSEFVVESDITPVRAVNGADGTFAFENVTFNKAGRYYFVISVDATAETENITFDESVYYVIVDVSDDGKGGLTASKPAITKKGSTEAVDTVEFSNVYTAPADTNDPEKDDKPWIWIAIVVICVLCAVIVSLVYALKKKRV